MRLSRFPISTLLDSASGHLEAHLYKKRLAAESGEPLAQQYSGIIFSGNPHETVPRRLLLDKRLTRWSGTAGKCSACSLTTTG